VQIITSGMLSVGNREADKGFDGSFFSKDVTLGVLYENLK
jgi:hypothetical protein